MTSLLTPSEARAEYRLGRDTLRRLIRDKHIPSVVISPRKVLLPRDGIESFIRRHAVPARRQFFSHLKG